MFDRRTLPIFECVDYRTLTKLVVEACGPYFSGDKSLDETAALVQNRMGLYISEQK